MLDNDPLVQEPGKGPSSSDLTGEGGADDGGAMDTGGKAAQDKKEPMETSSPADEEMSGADRESKLQVHSWVVFLTLEN